MSALETISDGLAGPGFAIVDNFLSKDETTAILQLDVLKDALLHFRRAGAGKQGQRIVNENIRGDYVKWIDRETAPEAICTYIHRLDELRGYLNRSLFLSLKDFEVHLTVYPPGAAYRRHRDQFAQDDHRRLSVICYLNENWTAKEGGQLRMFLPEGPVDVLPVASRLVCFRSDQIEHEVLPSTRERLSITGWMLDRIAGLDL